jgi:acetoin utilization deacetylase AcuC-like enzyme
MILYDKRVIESFRDFGIQIPVAADRSRAVFERLASDTALGPLKHRWYIPRIEETLSREDLLRVHGVGYVERLFSSRVEQEIMATYELIGPDGNEHRFQPRSARLPLAALFDRILLKAAGTVNCCRVALEEQFCFYLGGGMHHAHREYGSGFCLINDIVIALRKLQAEGRIRRAWVVDVDAHKGDGTASLTRADPSIRTLSIHMARGWPLDGPPHGRDGKLRVAFTPSDIDIPVEEHEAQRYNLLLEKGLHKLAGFSNPDLAVVVCGADPHATDALPSTSALKLSLAQMAQRDRTLYSFLKQRKIPAAFLMAGGYGEQSWKVYVQFLRWALTDRLRSGHASDAGA